MSDQPKVNRFTLDLQQCRLKRLWFRDERDLSSAGLFTRALYGGLPNFKSASALAFAITQVLGPNRSNLRDAQFSRPLQRLAHRVFFENRQQQNNAKLGFSAHGVVSLNASLKLIFLDLGDCAVKFAAATIKDGDWISLAQLKDMTEMMGFGSIEGYDVAERYGAVNEDPRNMHVSNRGF